MLGSESACTSGTGEPCGKAVGAVAPAARLPKPQAPSLGSTGAESSAAPSAGEAPGVIANEMPEQRSAVPGNTVPEDVTAPPISAVQARASAIGPTWLKSNARSAGAGSGLGGGGEPDSSGAICT